MQRAALPATGLDWAWRCLCPHCLCLCSLALFPAREVRKYIYSLHCSSGVLAALIHLCVLIHAAPNVLVQLWFNRTAHMFPCASLQQSRAGRPYPETCAGASACCSSSMPATLPAWKLPPTQMDIYKLHLYLSDLIKVCLRISTWNKSGLCMIHPTTKTKENLICSYFEELLPLFSISLFSRIFEMYDLNEYTTQAV